MVPLPWAKMTWLCPPVHPGSFAVESSPMSNDPRTPMFRIVQSSPLALMWRSAPSAVTSNR